MPFAIGDVVETVFRSQNVEQAGINVRHWTVTAAAPASMTDQDVANQFQALVGPLIAACMGSNSNMLQTAVRKVNGVPIGAQTPSNTPTIPGAVVSGDLPRQTSGLITLRTLTIGRKGRGRMYVPFPPTTLSDVNGQPTAGYLTALTALRNVVGANVVLTDGVNVMTFQPCLYKRGALVGTPVTSAVNRLSWATQRRRGSFGRPNALP